MSKEKLQRKVARDGNFDAQWTVKRYREVLRFADWAHARMVKELEQAMGWGVPGSVGAASKAWVEETATALDRYEKWRWPITDPMRKKKARKPRPPRDLEWRAGK